MIELAEPTELIDYPIIIKLQRETSVEFTEWIEGMASSVREFRDEIAERLACYPYTGEFKGMNVLTKETLRENLRIGLMNTTKRVQLLETCIQAFREGLNIEKETDTGSREATQISELRNKGTAPS